MSGFNFGRHMPRRSFLRGFGVAIPLPFLGAMIPAEDTRICCIEMVHGSAGSTVKGAARFLWSPAAVGNDFDLTPGSLSPLEGFRDYLTIVSNTDVRNADAFEPDEVGGDHARSSAVFLTQSRPKRTEGLDVRAGTSLDQLIAQRFGQRTPIASLQLCIEDIHQSGGTTPGYSKTYMDTISWASPVEPLPMIRDPRLVFDQLFNVTSGRREKRSILDYVISEIARLRRSLGAVDRVRLDSYLESVRQIERRIQRIEEFNRSGEPQILPDLPGAVPNDFEEHVKLMFDLQVQAFSADLTRIVAFKMGRDASSRVYPGSGVSLSFHAASHHAEREQSITRFAAINKYHVSLIPYFLEKLKSIEEGHSNLLEKTLIIYGSSMGNSNAHNHKRCPLILAGRANGRLKGNLHLKAPDGTPMANVFLSLLHELGIDDIEEFGDSTGAFNLRGV